MRGLPLVSFDEFFGVNLVRWFPRIVTFRVPFPLDKILERSSPSVASMINDALHLVFFFSANQIRWRSGEVWPMSGGFMIRRQ
jgi:hypothetical protein